MDKDIFIKIQKYLNRARYKSITESETKAVLFVAQKLIVQYNILQADLVANNDNRSKVQYRGISKVEIINVKSCIRYIIKEIFVYKLAKAIYIFFDCQYFSTDYEIFII